jgi:hypothetical protein
MGVNQQVLCFAVMEVELEDLLMDLLLTMDFFWQTFLESSMNK